MGHYGRKDTVFKTGDGDRLMGMGFQVSDVTKPLAAVCRICEKGNWVHFGPGEWDSYIENVETGDRVGMQRKGGSYVLAVEFMQAAEEAAAGFQRQSE